MDKISNISIETHIGNEINELYKESKAYTEVNDNSEIENRMLTDFVGEDKEDRKSVV